METYNFLSKPKNKATIQIFSSRDYALTQIKIVIVLGRD